MTRSRFFGAFVWATLSVVIADSSLRVQGQSGAQAPAHIIKKINVAGARDTLPSGIVADNTVFGSYQDSSDVTHGFMWNPTTFHITKINFPGSPFTELSGMNSTHVVTGTYPDSRGVFHGFLRSVTGHYTSFNAPGAGTGSGQGTIAADINDRGEIAGLTLTQTVYFTSFFARRGVNSPSSMLRERALAPARAHTSPVFQALRIRERSPAAI